jgi:FtsZ-binding cell division protein ZapB
VLRCVSSKPFVKMEDLETEIEELRERNDNLQREIDLLIEDRDNKVSLFEGKLEDAKHAVEKEYKLKMKELDMNCRKDLEAMAKELDIMRAAFSGDASGWVTKKTKSGREFYENLDTGETQEEMPEVLFIAEAMSKADKADEYIKEIEKLKEKSADAELRKREAENVANKLRTECNKLRDVEKGWRETSKTMSKQLTNVVIRFDKQADEIVLGMSVVASEALKVASRSPSIRKVTILIQKLQQKISAQEDQIRQLNNKNRHLQNELDDALAKVKRLSGGIEEEVERLVKPMRDKVADCMVQMMREKASRIQERRQIADLWPKSHLMPTLLMQYRALDPEEIERRVTRSKVVEASRALMYEIRKNVSESRKWTIEYDEYGRQFFQHSVTGETEWEQPEIMTYKPPPGRDDMGNSMVTEEDLLKGWTMKSDYRGVVYFESDATGEITYEPPPSYKKIPPGRSPELFVGEAANIVLTYIKGKIAKHIGNLKILKAKERGEEVKDEDMNEHGEGATEDLSQYLYDIETVEKLADVFNQFVAPVKSKKGDDVREVYKDERKDIKDYEGNGGRLQVEGMDEPKDNYMGPTLADVDVTEASFAQIRDIVELYSAMEEKLERRLVETRSNLKVKAQ